METNTICYFLAASVVLTLAPGPDILYLLTKSLSDGTKSGVALATGLCSGVMFHTALVIIGVAALVQNSPAAAMVLKYLGAAYLLYLAYKAFTDKGELKLICGGARVNPWKLWRQGVLMNVLNPKVLMFFLAFLPQFVDINAPQAGRNIAFLGFIFAAQALAIFSLVAFTAGKVRNLVLRRKNIKRVFNIAEGIVLTLIAAAILL